MTRSLRFFTCDVFTRTRFGGNQLAVLPDASGLNDAEMQSIAKEFNLSETTFVLPPDDARHAARVRIFTPGGELPFAGHPTVGTAFVLATIGAIANNVREIVFEEGVGPVSVTIERDGAGVTGATLSAARLPEQGRPPPLREALARLIGLAPVAVQDGSEHWSCGVPFLVIPVASVEALSRCALDLVSWRELFGGETTLGIYPVARADAATWRVRSFAPGVGIAEDPATGSAAAAFAGWLARRAPPGDATLAVTLHQGIEIGRASELRVAIDRAGNCVAAVRVGGDAVMVSEGKISV